MYQSEGAFSQALVRMLKKKFRMVQRIESGETGKGIPDIYLGGGLWAELKNMPKQSIYHSHYIIPWRPGQQAWAMKHQPILTYTACALKDGFIIIPMNQRFPKNIVKRVDTLQMTELRDIVEVLWQRK